MVGGNVWPSFEGEFYCVAGSHEHRCRAFMLARERGLFFFPNLFAGWEFIFGTSERSSSTTIRRISWF
jgi:hypothetical protein